MDEKSVIWTNTAVKQRNEIFKYWNEHNGNFAYSIQLNHKIRQRIIVLKNNPGIGKLTVLKNTRVLSMKHYSLLYKTNSSQIIITAFWDNRRNPEELLRFLREH